MITLNAEKKSIQQLMILFQLLRRDMYVLRQHIYGRMLNTAVWASITIATNHYIMPFLGLAPSYSKFILAGAIVVQMLFQAMAEVAANVEDLTGNKEITYLLGLAIPSWVVFSRYAITTAIQGLAMGVFAIPVAAIVMWGDFNFPSISLYKVVLMYVIQSIFFGFFSVWVTSFTKNMQQYEDVWLRVTLPLWMLGCYTYSFAVFRKAVPLFAPLCLLNPFTYAMEGARAAILGQHMFLNYWLCVVAVLVATVGFAVRGIMNMQKRLDTL
jgi:ABC-2 type transport system permease protein